MSVHSYHKKQQRKTRRNTLKVIIITAAIGAVAAIGALLFDAFWMVRSETTKIKSNPCFILFP
jgi:FtsZ-interacting cell division protein ZipA